MARKKEVLVKSACPDCYSKQTQFRKTDKVHWCRVCGCEWTLNDNKEPVVQTSGSLTKEG